MGLNADQLLVLISESEWGIPVRDMESLIELGEEALTKVIEFVERGLEEAKPKRDLLWPIVVLGEMKDPRAIPTLTRALQRGCGYEVPVAAAEAMGKMGLDGFNAICDLLANDPEPRVRILLYGALAETGLQEAWDYLEEALDVDLELDFVIARALAQSNDPRYLDVIYRVYLQAEPWKRAAFEETLVGIMTGRHPWSLPYKDWRLRYRPQPRQDLKVHRSWPDVLLMLWDNRHLLRPSPDAEPLSMEELFYRATLRRQERTCPDCGQVFRSPTGVPLCGEVEEDLIEYQIRQVRQWISHRWDDIHEVLDELDRHEMEALQLPEGTDEERLYKAEALDSIEVMKNTLCWMVEQGAKGLREGEKRLWKAYQRARSRPR